MSGERCWCCLRVWPHAPECPEGPQPLPPYPGFGGLAASFASLAPEAWQEVVHVEVGEDDKGCTGCSRSVVMSLEAADALAKAVEVFGLTVLSRVRGDAGYFHGAGGAPYVFDPVAIQDALLAYRAARGLP